MTTATKSDFFSAPLRRREPVYIAALGKTVYVQSLTVAERTAYEKKFQKKNGETNPRLIPYIRVYLVIATCVDEQGDHLFSDSDADRLHQMDIGLIEPIVNKAQELSGVSDADIEELAGNSEGTDGGETSAD